MFYESFIAINWIFHIKYVLRIIYCNQLDISYKICFMNHLLQSIGYFIYMEKDYFFLK